MVAPEQRDPRYERTNSWQARVGFCFHDHNGDRAFNGNCWRIADAQHTGDHKGMISLATVGATIANNRAVQVALGIGIAVVGFLAWLAQHDRGVRKNERLRVERRARKTQARIEEKSNEKSKQVARASESAPRGVRNVSELSNGTRSRLIRTE